MKRMRITIEKIVLGFTTLTILGGIGYGTYLLVPHWFYIIGGIIGMFAVTTLLLLCNTIGDVVGSKLEMAGRKHY